MKFAYCNLCKTLFNKDENKISLEKKSNHCFNLYFLELLQDHSFG